MPRSNPFGRWLRRWFIFVGVTTSVVLVAAGIAGTWLGRRSPEVPAATLLELPLDRPLVERRDPSPLTRLLGREPLTVRAVVEALERARNDTRVVGVVAYLGGADHGMALTQELRDAVARFRESGKPAVAFADAFGEVAPGNQAYYLATAFDEIWLQPSGDLGLSTWDSRHTCPPLATRGSSIIVSTARNIMVREVFMGPILPTHGAARRALS